MQNRTAELPTRVPCAAVLVPTLVLLCCCGCVLLIETCSCVHHTRYVHIRNDFFVFVVCMCCCASVVSKHIRIIVPWFQFYFPPCSCLRRCWMCCIPHVAARLPRKSRRWHRFSKPIRHIVRWLVPGVPGWHLMPRWYVLLRCMYEYCPADSIRVSYPTHAAATAFCQSL